jgi:hypothetical protein
MKTPIVAVCAVAASLSLAACGGREGNTPQGSDVAAAMPDTSAGRADNRQMTAPDAGATGAVPADNNTPPAVAATPPMGTAGGGPVVGGPTTADVPAKK